MFAMVFGFGTLCPFISIGSSLNRTRVLDSGNITSNTIISALIEELFSSFYFSLLLKRNKADRLILALSTTFIIEALEVVFSCFECSSILDNILHTIIKGFKQSRLLNLGFSIIQQLQYRLSLWVVQLDSFYHLSSM